VITNRRNLLLQLAGAAIGAAAIPQLARAGESVPCDQSPLGPYAGYFPNVVVQTHEGKRALFYNDLLRGKTVLVHCMSIADETRRPAMASLRDVHCLLGERAGRDVFLYSLTVDPQRDTPRALAAFAERQEAGPGWLFITGRPDAMQSLRGRLFLDAAGGHAHAGAEGDCSLRMVRYGNEAVGLWGTVPLQSDPRAIVERIAWVTAQAATHGAAKRGGPSPQRMASQVSR
jgi:protein SCO1/2